MRSPGSPPPSGNGRVAAPVDYELKFLLAEPVAGEIEAWARDRLAVDRHADPALGRQYRTTTLYLDTPALDVLHALPGFRRRKYRLRRYGREPRLYLERKIRRGDAVRKRRVAVPEEALATLAGGEAAHGGAEGDAWFRSEIAQRTLGPAATITYLRTAFEGGDGPGPRRLTLDRAIRGARTRDWKVATPDPGLELGEGVVICELKFRGALPAPFRDLIAAFKLKPAAASKYRRLMRAALGAAGGSVADG